MAEARAALSETEALKVPPHSIEAEQAVLGGLMLVDGFTPSPYSALSALIAGVVGYLMIDVLLRFARRISFWKICVGLGAIALAAWLPTLFV